MAVGNRLWSVPPRRFGASVVLTTIGVFTICGGIGKNDLTVGALGVAILAVAVGIYVLSALNSRTLAFVHGTGHVVSASPPPSTTTYGRCTLQLLVTARNMVGVPVKFRDPKVPLAKWPDAGSDLPIMVALGSSRKVRVLWDEVPQHGTPQAQAQAKAAGVRVPPPPPPAYEDDEFTRPGYDDIGTTDIYGDDDAGLDVLDDEPTVGRSVYETDDEIYDDLTVDDPPEPTVDDRPRPRPHPAPTTEPTPAPTVIIPPPRAGSAWRDLPNVDLSGIDENVVTEPEAAADDDLAGLGVTETNGKRTIELDVSDPSLVRWSDRPENAGASEDPTSGGPTGAGSTGHDSPDSYGSHAEPPTDGPEPGLPRRTPSPRPRMGVNQPMRDGVRKPAPPAEPEAVVGIDFGTEPPLETPYVIPDVVITDIPASEFDDPLLVSAALTDSMPTVPIRIQQARVVSPGVAAAPDSDDLLFDQAADGGTVADAYIAATPPPGTVPGTVGRIRSVAATLFVTDLSRSIIFYRDVLGFIEADAGRGSAVLVSGDAKIVLRRVGMPPVDRRLVQLLLEVPDVNAAYEDLRARSVPFIHRPRKVGQYEQQTLWAAALRDPDGHGIAITQWRAA